MNIKLNGDALTAARKEAGLSREKLVFELNKIGMPATVSVIKAWEKIDGCPKSIRLFFAICQILQKDASEFILTTDPEKENADD